MALATPGLHAEDVRKKIDLYRYGQDDGRFSGDVSPQLQFALSRSWRSSSV